MFINGVNDISEWEREGEKERKWMRELCVRNEKIQHKHGYCYADFVFVIKMVPVANIKRRVLWYRYIMLLGNNNKTTTTIFYLFLDHMAEEVEQYIYAHMHTANVYTYIYRMLFTLIAGRSSGGKSVVYY